MILNSRMCSVVMIFLLTTLAIGTPEISSADEVIPHEAPVPMEGKSSDLTDNRHSLLVGTLLYVPNRVLDLLDIFRLRVRVGPGIAAGVRATQVAQMYAGSYVSVYAGLPGPRMRRTPRLPVGLETHNGASISVVDATADGGFGPHYSPTEIGGGIHLGIVGFEFGIDPVEIADFGTGLVTVDIREDDL